MRWLSRGCWGCLTHLRINLSNCPTEKVCEWAAKVESRRLQEIDFGRTFMFIKITKLGSRV